MVATQGNHARQGLPIEGRPLPGGIRLRLPGQDAVVAVLNLLQGVRVVISSCVSNGASGGMGVLGHKR